MALTHGQLTTDICSIIPGTKAERSETNATSDSVKTNIFQQTEHQANKSFKSLLYSQTNKSIDKAVNV